MKSLPLHVLDAPTPTSAAQIPALLDAAELPFNAIDQAPWANDFPYQPTVKFRIAATTEALLLHYQVDEDYVAAAATADNGPVWEDSCCEFFCQPVADGTYYNIECNCMGTLLVGFGASRNSREWAPQPILDGVLRWTSLADKPGGTLPCRQSEGPWELALVVPFATFFHHHVNLKDLKTLKVNFYKCGDKLPKPHFLAWNNIATPSPDFHRPDFFGCLIKSE